MSLLLFCFFSFMTKAQAQNFPVNGMKSITVSLPKGKVTVSASKTQKDVSVAVEAIKGADNKKCTKSVGLENSQLFVKVSSDNILFEKADCDYDVKVTTPMTQAFDLDISTGSGNIFVRDLNGTLNLKTATGIVDIEGDVLKNINAKTATGPMSFHYKTCSGRADLDLMSATGKVALKLPGNCKIRVDYKSATGKLFNGIGESEDYQIFINAKSASGDFSILKM